MKLSDFAKRMNTDHHSFSIPSTDEQMTRDIEAFAEVGIIGGMDWKPEAEAKADRRYHQTQVKLRKLDEPVNLPPPVDCTGMDWEATKKLVDQMQAEHDRKLLERMHRQQIQASLCAQQPQGLGSARGGLFGSMLG